MFIMLNIANSCKRYAYEIGWFSTGFEKTKSNRENKRWSLLPSQSVCQVGIRSRQLPAHFFRYVDGFLAHPAAVIFLIHYSKTGILSFFFFGRVLHYPLVNLEYS